MMLLKRAGTAALIAAAVAVGSSAGTISASAAPAAGNVVNGTISVVNSDLLNDVQYKDGRGDNNGGKWRRGDRRGGEWRQGDGRRRYRNRDYYDDGFNPGPFIALGIAGALIEGGSSDNDSSYSWSDD